MKLGLALLLVLAVAAPASAARRPAPEISGATLDGKRISLAQFRGRPVVINIWSSW